jgi:ankyrin repeat protein
MLRHFQEWILPLFRTIRAETAREFDPQLRCQAFAGKVEKEIAQLACTTFLSYDKLVTSAEQIREDPHIQTTGIHYAVDHGSSHILKILLLSQEEDVAAAINAQNFLHYTPIHLAVLRSNVTIAKILLENGAKINAKAFSWAATIAHTEMLGPILHGCTNMEAAVMMRLVSNGMMASLELILEFASKVNRQAELSS